MERPLLEIPHFENDVATMIFFVCVKRHQKGSAYLTPAAADIDHDRPSVPRIIIPDSFLLAIQ